MSTSNREWISIHSVSRDLQVELSNEQAWEVGKQMAAAWVRIMKRPPVKDLRTKKAGAGSHCFALYPPSWQPMFEAAIRVIQAQAARQGQFELWNSREVGGDRRPRAEASEGAE